MTTTTWTNALADNDGDNAGNWDNGVPTSALDTVITGSDNVTFAGAISMKSLDTTGYTGTFGGGSVVMYGDVTLGAGMSFSGYIDFDFTVSATLTANNVEGINTIYCTGADVITLGSHCRLTGGGNTTVSNLAFGAYELRFPNGAGQIGIGAATYSAGAKIIVGAGACSFGHGGSIPPVECTDTDVTFTSGDTIASWTHTGGSLVIDGAGASITGNMTLTNMSNVGLTFDAGWSVGGNLSVTNCTLNGTDFVFTWTVTGTAVASLSTITDCDFSGGTELDATNCVDGTGNTNVSFSIVTTSTTWTGASTTSWHSAANWTNGVPDAFANVTFGGSVNCVVSSPVACRSIDFTGFTGTFTPHVSWDFVVYGNITLVPGIGTSFKCKIDNDCTFTSNGATVSEIHVWNTDHVLTLADNLAVTKMFQFDGVGTLAFGSNDLVLGGSNMAWVSLADVIYTYSAGASLTVNAATTNIGVYAGTSTLPPTTLTGASAGTVLDVVSLKAESITHNGGTFKSSGTFETTGNCTFNGHAFDDNGGTGIVGGNFVTYIDLVDTNPIVITVTGTAEAHDSTITYCDFSGGTELDASDNCVDGGNNTNVSFIDMGTATWNGSVDDQWGDTPGAANANWSTGVTPDIDTDVIITGSGTVSLGTTDDEHYCKSLDFTGFTGTFNPTDPVADGFTLYVAGNLTMSAAMTLGFPIYLGIEDGATMVLTTAGHPFATVDFGSSVANTLTLADDLTASQFYPSSVSTVNWGDHNITLGGVVAHSSFAQLGSFSGLMTVNYDPGATLILNPTQTSPDLNFSDGNVIGYTLPPTTVTGTQVLLVSSSGGSPVHFESLEINGAGVNIGGGAPASLETDDDMTFTAGVINGLAGRTLTVGGDFSSDGVDLVGVATWTLDVTGTATADDCTVAYCNATGTTLTVTNGINGLNNSNVNFGSFVQVARSKNRSAADGKKRISVANYRTSQSGHYGETAIETEQI